MSNETLAPESGSENGSAQALREAAPAQNLPFGVAAGVAAMLVGTAVWTAVTVGTGYQIGYLAVGVGFLVGISIRWAGKGSTPVFSVIGAVLALLGCVLGNLFTGCQFLATEINEPFFQVVSDLDLETAKAILTALFSPMDILFYGLAAFAGWKYSVISEA